MRLIFSSNNNHKLEEMKAILGDKYATCLYSLDDFNIKIDPNETGMTFEENANIKSKAAYDALVNKGILKIYDFIFADDSGLCIDFFDGAPGIYSARFMGDISQTNKNKKIIELMKDVEYEDRKACFISKISVIPILIDKDIIDMPSQILFEGKVKGFITKEIKEGSGFGYDPIFAVDECSDISKGIIETYSTIGKSKKNSISHRAKAMASFVNYLEKSHNI